MIDNSCPGQILVCCLCGYLPRSARHARLIVFNTLFGAGYILRRGSPHVLRNGQRGTVAQHAVYAVGLAFFVVLLAATLKQPPHHAAITCSRLLVLPV